VKIVGAVAPVHASLIQKAVVGAVNNGMAKKCVMHLWRPLQEQDTGETKE
jgi:hypothetical protein